MGGDHVGESLETLGFAVLDRAVSPDACDLLRTHAWALARSLLPAAGAFSTGARPQDGSAAFEASGAGVAAFCEPGRPDVPNKLGHALHDLDPVVRGFVGHEVFANAAAMAGCTSPRLVQSMVIFKAAGSGGEVSAHQDATFLRTDPPTVLGFWVALEDADEDNGALEVLPGAHRGGLRQRYGRVGDRLAMTTLDPTPWPEEGWIHLPARKGTVVVLDGLLPHRSAANRSERARAAFTLHVVDGRAWWCDDNWIRRPPDLPFRGFPSAGPPVVFG